MLLLAGCIFLLTSNLFFRVDNLCAPIASPTIIKKALPIGRAFLMIPETN